MIATPQLLSQDQPQVFCGAWKTSGCCFASTVRDLQVQSDSSDVGDQSSDSDSESGDSSDRSSDSDGESGDSSDRSSDSGGQSMVCFPWCS